MMKQLDIIVPIYNEAESVEELFLRIDKSLIEAKIDYKIIFVDDKSTDDTIQKLKKLPSSKVEILVKKGKRGKAYSILEGFDASEAPVVAMIDGDLEYPPEALPEMYKKMELHGATVGRRQNSHGTWWRRFGSKLNRAIFGRFLLGFNCDVQSGLKMFKREVFEHLDRSGVSGWALDMPLLHTTLELGYSIGEVNINFSPRMNGNSQLKKEFFSAILQIAGGALRLKRSKNKIYPLNSTDPDSSLGSGLVHMRKRYITHTKLPIHLSALLTITNWQKYALFGILMIIGLGFLFSAKATALVVVGILTLIYFLDVLFNLFLVFKSLHFPPEFTFSDDELAKIDDKNLPTYSILCPLYKEAHVLPEFVKGVNALDWPKGKLEVLLLLEEDDEATIKVARKMDLPSHFKILVVPHSFPKTKPKACNYGLAHTTGEYVVIYDAEDRPDPMQLKKAYLGFKNSPEKVICLQAKLNYYNPHQNILTRLFTAEYSLWFDMVLPGLQSINTSIPLGGTSNHFKTSILKSLHGWDAFNVTEDADLGARLFKAGYRTSIIDSTTLEEANSRLGNWFRQRSRWIKGYIQTYLVHNRNPIQFVRSHGIHAFIFQLVVGGKIAFMVINPLLWLATILYFTMYSVFGPAIESLYPAPIFYMAVVSLVFGNFLFLYYYMIGAAKRGHWEIMKYIYLIPFYWLAVSGAALKAFIQLVMKPHYWEKTNHGLHVQKTVAMAQVAHLKSNEEVEEFDLATRIKSSAMVSGGLLVVATIVANFFNFLYNAYLSRSGSISIQEFGAISLFGSLLEIIQVPSQSIAKTVTYKTAYLLGKHQVVIKRFWAFVRARTLVFALFATAIWIFAIPLLAKYFNVPSALPFILFTPIWIIGALGATDRGFLTGVQKFGILAMMTVIEAVSKFIITVLMIEFGLSEYIYLSIPGSLAISFVISWFVAGTMADTSKSLDNNYVLDFPKKFFATSVLTRISSIAFLSLDVILAKIYLPPTEAGQYALISLVGKMVYFVGSLFSQFITPVVSKDEGAGKNSRRTFYKLIGVTTLASTLGFLAFGVLGQYSVPILFGVKSLPILSMLPWYALAMVVFSIATNIVSYHQIKKQYFFPVLGFLLSVLQVVAMMLFHENIATFVGLMLILGSIYLGLVLLAHFFYHKLLVIFHNLMDFSGLFFAINGKKEVSPSQLNILIFNWRDTKHKWAGGAEVYLHELSKRWVKEGHNVTIFCGNDEHCKTNEVVDGVNIIRHGGFYTVYIWAFLYYIFRLKGKYDLVIDSENGIPFFTPFYVSEPKLLLIYHVHQDMFRDKLYFPMDQVAMFLESKAMPFVYRNQKIVTISESSKAEIVNLGFGSSKDITIITPGIDLKKFTRAKKSKDPLFSYVGRLRPQKNVDVAIKAFAILLKRHPKARLAIGGWGENIEELKSLVKDLKIEKSARILGRLTDSRRKELLAKSWAMLQPSSFEGWGITVIEANASGTMVIGSEVVGLKDSIVHNKTGILVPVKNELALARAMGDIINKPSLLNKLGKNAYKWSTKFSWDLSSENFVEVIHKELFGKSRYNTINFLVEQRW